ncbi:MAG: hypothetical protein JWO32_2968 [Bacteroidetes bacterium]|nr:hypothetical protein [Bacteroidota bacterium]
MARDYNKQQTWYEVTVYFKHGTKKYNLTTVDALEGFLKSADMNVTVLHYIVESVSKFVYPNWQSAKFRIFDDK